MNEYGWTGEEFEAAPEAITRLHKRILDLEDRVEALIEDLNELETENERLNNDLIEMSDHLGS